jgi:hypothetical protein
MNIKLIKEYIKKFDTKSKSDVLDYLKSMGNHLTVDEKNAIFVYLFPISLLDRELPGKIQSNRGRNYKGELVPCDSEIVLLQGAYKSKQYNRYIRHLLHSFMDPKNVYPLTGRFKTSCGSCGKELYHFEVWEEECNKFPKLDEKNKKEFLAYGSKTSDIELCLDCLVQLNCLNDILKQLEGNDYLTKWERKK